MKRTTLLAPVFILALASACEKRFPDHRNKFTGEYTMTVDSKVYAAPPSNSDTVYSYEGEIWYNRKDPKNTIHLDYGINKDQVLTLEKDGDLLQGSEHVGKFSKSSKTFSYTYETWSPGHHAITVVTGKKK